MEDSVLDARNMGYGVGFDFYFSVPVLLSASVVNIMVGPQWPVTMNETLEHTYYDVLCTQ